MLKKIDIYIDGSCLNNPGPGGCAALIKINNFNEKKIFKAGFYYTTNNRMELMSAILILKYLFNSVFSTKKINIFTDSNYLYSGITNWIYLWKRNKWKNSSNKIVKNIDLWFKLEYLLFLLNIPISWNLIKGHSNNLNNNICDKIAIFSAKNPKYIDLNQNLLLKK